MPERKIYDEPSEVAAEEGAVMVRGPDQFQVDFTPDAAEETSTRLLEGSLKARGQRYFKEERER